MTDRDASQLWQIWPSRGNFIFLEGICITGRHPLILFLILLFAVIPYISFVLNNEQIGSVSLSVWILNIWFAITISLILKVSLSDPGIIPRRAVAKRMYAHIIDRSEAESLIDPYKEDPASSFCYTCEISRPSHASHCSDCDNCVLGLDHHCAVLNNCIGLRNYPFFLMLLPSVFFTTVSLMFQIRIPGYEKQEGVEHSTTYTFIIAISMTIAIVSLLFVSGLLLYHTWLVCVNKTTRQHLRGKVHGNLSIWNRLKGSDSLFNLRDPVNLPARTEC